jgi:hypothetical protein
MSSRFLARSSSETQRLKGWKGWSAGRRLLEPWKHRGEGSHPIQRNNPMHLRMHQSPRCHARTRRSSSCRSPAMANGRAGCTAAHPPALRREIETRGSMGAFPLRLSAGDRRWPRCSVKQGIWLKRSVKAEVRTEALLRCDRSGKATEGHEADGRSLPNSVLWRELRMRIDELQLLAMGK